jgi:hypothetical protein
MFLEKRADYFLQCGNLRVALDSRVGLFMSQHAVRRAKGYFVQLTNAISLTYEAVLVSAAALLITVLVLISFPVGAVSG